MEGALIELKARGVSRIYVVDIMEKRLEKAMELGADGIINGAKEDMAERAGQLTDGIVHFIKTCFSLTELAIV